MRWRPSSMDRHPGVGARARETPPREAVRAVLTEGEIRVHLPFGSPALQRVRSLPGRRWDRELRAWRLTDSPAARDAVRQALGVEPTAAGPGSQPPAGPSPRPSPSPASEPRGPTSLPISFPDSPILRFDEEMRLRGYGARTRKAYLGHARRFLEEAGEVVGDGTDGGSEEGGG